MANVVLSPRVKCVGGLEEFSAQKQHIKYCKGVQHNYRLAKNTKKKELDTAQYNDALHLST